MGQAIEDAGANALRCHQIQLGIDPSEHPAVFSDLAAAVPSEIAERLQHQADLVEVVGDGVAARVHPELQPRALSLESERAFSPPRVGFAVGATLAWVVSQGHPPLINLRLDPCVDASDVAALGIKIDPADPGPERGGEITPGGGVLGIEVLADLHTSRYQRRCRKVSD